MTLILQALHVVYGFMLLPISHHDFSMVVACNEGSCSDLYD